MAKTSRLDKVKTSGKIGLPGEYALKAEREELLDIRRDLNNQVARLESVADFGKFYIFFTVGMFVLGIAVNVMVLNKKLGV